MRKVTTERAWSTTDDCDLEQFRQLVERPTDLSDHPLADRVEQGVLVYGDAFRAAAGDRCRDLQAELARPPSDGPGVLVVEGAVPEAAVLHRDRRPTHVRRQHPRAR